VSVASRSGCAGSVADLFAEKRTGHPADSATFVPSKDVETARQLLAELPFVEMSDFIGYALDAARRTNFDVQTLGGIKLYLAGYMARKKRRMSAEANGRLVLSGLILRLALTRPGICGLQVDRSRSAGTRGRLRLIHTPKWPTEG
jgi:hypothetical protein